MSYSPFVSNVAPREEEEEEEAEEQDVVVGARTMALARSLLRRRSARLMTPEAVDALFEASLMLVADLKHAYRHLPCTVQSPGRLPDNPIRHIVDESVLEMTRLVLRARYHRWPTIFVFGVPRRRRDTAIEIAAAVGNYYLRCVAAHQRGQMTRECCARLRRLVSRQYSVYFL